MSCQTNPRQKRVGLFGGTFDPPHIGHLQIAKEAKTALGLDEVWLIPTFAPPHKEGALVSSEERVHMTQLLIKDECNLHVCTYEVKKQSTSYTIETVEYFTERYPGYSFYFIIGADMVEYLPKWKEIDRLMDLVTFVAFDRKNFKVNHGDVVHLKREIPSISSTEVRNAILKEEAFSKYLTARVAQYIKEKELYGYSKDINRD